MNRRGFLRSTAIVAAAVPVMTVTELVRPDRPALSPVTSGQVFTAASWNQLVARVNELSMR